MKWTVKIVAEAPQGNLVEQEVGTIEREDSINPATLGLTIAEGKAIMESLQREVVAAQVQRHGVAGKVLDEHGAATRFAFVRQGGSDAASAAGLALRRHGITENTSLTVLTDGDAACAPFIANWLRTQSMCWTGFTSACDFRISSRWQRASQV